MWTSKQPPDSAGPSSGVGVDTLPEPAPAQATPPKSTLETPHAYGSAARVPAWLGPGLKIKGEISGAEDLQIECNVDGPISLGDHRLTVGQNSHVSGPIAASEVVIYGEVRGNLLASKRIEIKKHGSVLGNLTTSRIMIEDGAYFKGAIEVTSKIPPTLDLDAPLARSRKETL